jgi:beta-lactamase regulating signal transducer with metallopeptidase domain
MLWWLVQNTVCSVALATVVAMLCRLLRPGPAVRHALWLLVLLKLLTPPLVVWPWPAPNMTEVIGLRPDLVTGSAAPDGPALGADGRVDAAPDGEGSRQRAVPSNAAGQTAADRVPESPARGWSFAWLAPLALATWLGGAVVMGGVQLVRLVRLRRLVARGRPAPPVLAEQVGKMAAKLRVRRPGVLVVPEIGSPCVWGVGNPRLLWPAPLEDRLSPDAACTVIVHELAHLRRRDHWAAWLQLAAQCAWWWNPLFWCVSRQVRWYAELACDAWVLWALPRGRRAYAEALIEVTQYVSRTAAPVPAPGMGGARHHLEKRLTMIMRDSVPCKVPLAGFVAIGLLGLIALPTWSQVEAPRPEQPKQANPPTNESADAIIVRDLVLALQADDSAAEAVQVVPAQQGGADRDQKLQRLEQQLQALLQEVRAMRAGGAGIVQVTPRVVVVNPAAPQEAVTLPPPTADKAPGQVRLRVRSVPGTTAPDKADVAPALNIQEKRRVVVYLTESGDQPVRLSRATYHLPAAKGEALAAFLRDHFKAEVLEVKLEADRLTVTTTPEAQKAIGQLIALVQGNKSASLSGTAAPQANTTPSVIHLRLRDPLPAQADPFRVQVDQEKRIAPEKPDPSR